MRLQDAVPVNVATSPSSVDLPDIQRLLHGARPDVTPDAPAYRAGVFLLCGPPLGFNVDRIRRITKYPASQVAIAARRLFDNGIWHHQGAVYTWRGPGDEDFWRDVAVAEGKLRRRSDQAGRIEWLPAGASARDVDDSGRDDYRSRPSSEQAHSARNNRLSLDAGSLFPDARWL